MKKIALYSGSVFLFVFYVCILWMGLHPHTGELYRMFYLDNELRYYAGEDMLTTYGPNIEFGFYSGGKNYNIGSGWDKISEYGTWALGECSSFYFWLEDINEDSYVLQMEVPINPAFHRELFVNGNLVGELQGDVASWSIEVDKAFLQKDLNTFEIRTKEDVPAQNELFPDGTDDRELNFLVTNICLATRQSFLSESEFHQ